MALSGAEGLGDRVEKARQAVDTKLFDTLQPAARAARERLDEAREAAPELLVDRLLGDAPTCGATVADFEAALAEAEAAVEENRRARRVLGDEADRAQIAIGQARKAVDAAIAAVVGSDPARQAVLDEFNKCARRALRCAKVLRTAGMIVRGAEAHGLAFRITDAAVPVGKTAFTPPDRDWAAALAALWSDADAPLPGLPAEAGAEAA